MTPESEHVRNLEAQGHYKLIGLHFDFSAGYWTGEIGSDERDGPTRLHCRYRVGREHASLRGNVACCDEQPLPVDNTQPRNGLLGLVEAVNDVVGRWGIQAQRMTS